jgi:hypothetical protein
VVPDVAGSAGAIGKREGRVAQARPSLFLPYAYENSGVRMSAVGSEKLCDILFRRS